MNDHSQTTIAKSSETINPELPLVTEGGHPAYILHDLLSAPVDGNKCIKVPRFRYIGFIKIDHETFLRESWDANGYASTNQVEHHIHHPDDIDYTEVWLNVYQDGTTGYGYKSEETAEKYALQDGNTQLKARVKATLMFKDKQGL